jgi:hypothetical protein
MSDSNAMTGQGTIFKRGTAPVAEINSISGPGMSRETIDVTTLDVVDGYRRFIGSLRDAGTITLNMNFTRATYLLFKADFESDDPEAYSIELPDDDDTTITFDGLVTELPLNIPTGDKMTADVTIKIAGKVNVSGESA